MAKILVVEDEKAIQMLLARSLEMTGHKCLTASDGQQATEILQKEKIDLLLLDIMLPKKDGFAVLEEVQGRIATIVITARNGLSDRLTGLNLGADDYIVKPFEILEVIARVQAVLRRTQKLEAIFEIGNVSVDFAKREAQFLGQKVELRPQEFALLRVLIENRNVALSRERLIELAWGFDFYGETRTVDVHIRKLRQKLGLEKYIKTIFKMGYRLEVEVP